MKNNISQAGRENPWRRFAARLFLSLVIAMASLPLAARADQACGPNAVEISRTDNGNSVQVKCKCATGYVFKAGGCVPGKPKAIRKPTALCPSLESQMQVAQTAASRAALAEDVYNLYSEKRTLPTHWTAPPGFNLVTNNLAVLRQIFPFSTTDQMAYWLDPPGTSYRAAIYATNEGSTLIVVFRGTSKGLQDWEQANGPNHYGIKSWYFQRAAELAQAVHRYTEAKHLKLEMVGHSLGGGLATYAGLKVGAKTTVFNAENVRQPGLPNDAAQQAQSLVSDYITTRDPVSGLQVDHPALGREIVLSDFPGAPQGMRDYHEIGFVRKALAARLENLSRALTSNSCGQ